MNPINVDNVGESDSKSFRDIGVPTITIHSVTQETYQIPHTPKDRIDKIQWDDYFQTYKLVTIYLAYLDTQLSMETAPARETP